MATSRVPGMGSTKKECQSEAPFWNLCLDYMIALILYIVFFHGTGGGHPRSFFDFKGLLSRLDDSLEVSSNMRSFLIGLYLTILVHSISRSEPILEACKATRTLLLRLRLPIHEMDVPELKVGLVYSLVTIFSMNRAEINRPIYLVTLTVTFWKCWIALMTYEDELKPGKPQNAERQNVPSKSDNLRTQEEPSRVLHVSSTSTMTTGLRQRKRQSSECYHQQSHSSESRLSTLGTGENPREYWPKCSQPDTQTSPQVAQDLTEGRHVSSPSACEPEEHTLLGQSGRPSQYPQQQQHRILEPSTCTSGGYVEPTGNGRKRAQLSTGQRVSPSPESSIEPDDNDMDVDKTENYSSAAHETSANRQCEKHFYMDSGAVYHSTYDLSVIKPYPAHLNIEPPINSISGFTGQEIPVEGSGYINTSDIGVLDFVLFIPNSTANLVSIGQLTKEYNVKVVFYREKAWIEQIETGDRIGQGHRLCGSNHYVLDSFKPTTPASPPTTC